MCFQLLLLLQVIILLINFSRIKNVNIKSAKLTKSYNMLRKETVSKSVSCSECSFWNTVLLCCNLKFFAFVCDLYWVSTVLHLEFVLLMLENQAFKWETFSKFWKINLSFLGIKQVIYTLLVFHLLLEATHWRPDLQQAVLCQYAKMWTWLLSVKLFPV